jgi:hypothetical protein
MAAEAEFGAFGNAPVDARNAGRFLLRPDNRAAGRQLQLGMTGGMVLMVVGGSNRFRVTFAGNSSTPRDSVQNYLLFRAAELTVQEGFDYFTVADQDVERSTRYYSQGFYDDYGYPYSLRSRRYTRSYIGPRFYSSSARPVDEYTNVADILMFEGEKPAADVNAYDAKDVLERLQVTINQPAS